ncbi:hypothetical protein HHK36_032168 [Tetracentron sinense]|uniref:Ubiquinol oxidase n=1 Tax=Tetracentron sinense TaxID=13715 RepID=A0A834Y5M6_TETSI|nr:hypothetical protein HHK36_032168 [Tetracentron sinense]
MATSLSTTFFAISVSSCSSFETRNCRNSASFYSRNPIIYNPLSSSSSFPCSSHRLLSRKLYRIQATILQDNEEKVAVEDSFQPKSFPDNEGKGISVDPLESTSSSVLERWTIKVEQSVNIFLTDSVIKILDTLYHDRHYARFFVLETIARVPYFAFMSVLHMYESFGWWRRADYLKVHFAESWNEMHHLLIMEELGGNAWWFDRFLAQHIAVFYYFMTVFMYIVSPRMACKALDTFLETNGPLKGNCEDSTYVFADFRATFIDENTLDVTFSQWWELLECLPYHFSECVEMHAFATYDKFIKVQGDELEKMPAPEVAVKYYTEGDLYLFDEFQTSRAPQSRRPKIENLYDVFLNIRDDEAEHCKTMKACQTHGNLRSPHSYSEDAFEDSGCILPQADCEGIVDCIKKSVTSPQGKAN